MKKFFCILSLMVGAIVMPVSVQAADLYIGDDQNSSDAFANVTAGSWERSTSSDNCCNPINLVNGNGFDAETGTHDNTAWTNTDNGGAHWLTDKNKWNEAPADYLGIPNSDLTFVALEFNQTEQVGDIHVWNYNDGCCLSRGTTKMRVQYSAVEAPSEGGDWSDLGIFDMALGSGRAEYAGELLGTGAFTARHVVLSVVANGASNPTLSEIRFIPIPEPATMGLMAMGGLLMLRRRP